MLMLSKGKFLFVLSRNPNRLFKEISNWRTQIMRPAPTICPICQSELEVARLHCSACDTSIEGHFVIGQFSNLTPEQLEFVFTLVRCEGKINRMEQEVGLKTVPLQNHLQWRYHRLSS